MVHFKFALVTVELIEPWHSLSGLRSRKIYDPTPTPRISRMPTPTPAFRILRIPTPTPTPDSLHQLPTPTSNNGYITLCKIRFV